MKRIAAPLLALLAACASRPSPSPAPLPPAPGDELNGPLRAAVEAELPSILELYRWFHQNPELSLQEEKTAARFAAEVRQAGWTVTEKVGGTGVVAVLANGDGPAVLVRIDMDALPVREETGLPYASTTGVMHACGHDTHLATGVALARVLSKLRDRWSGTVILVGQPAEEIGLGARKMLEDPRFHQAAPFQPVACLSLHNHLNRTGTVAICPGYAAANVDSLDITIFGRGGHGAWPHNTVDPIVVASEIVLALQTIVSRKLAPGTRAVVTVGSFQAGKKHNVIPDEAKLLVTVRSYEEPVRQKLLSEIRQITEKVAEAHRAPRPPEVRASEDFVPAVYHDPALAQRLRGVFERLLGKENVLEAHPVMGGEDFGRFPLHFKAPGLQFQVGAARAGHPPGVGLHSSQWAPDPEPTLRIGALALCRAALDLLGPQPGTR